ncbi:MAG: hypothetical protein VXX85_05285, partial [Candidatus Margulisiibacteriota bacterium]|nr:hypothetical protein [Candidatus Margulisiibacteriota bacterium]
MIYINFKITSNQHIEHLFNKPTKTEIKDFITNKIREQFSPAPEDEEEPATIYKQSLNKLISNLTKCYIELVHDTAIVPKESLEIDGPIEHYYELLNVLFEIDDHFRPFFEKGLKKDFETKINRPNFKKDDLEYIDLEQGETRHISEFTNVSIMTKEEEESIGRWYNRIDFFFNNVIPGLIFTFDVLGFFYDVERVLSDPKEVGKNYEEN